MLGVRRALMITYHELKVQFTSGIVQFEPCVGVNKFSAILALIQDVYDVNFVCRKFMFLKIE
jgi:hypothetical protein